MQPQTTVSPIRMGITRPLVCGGLFFGAWVSLLVLGIGVATQTGLMLFGFIAFSVLVLQPLTLSIRGGWISHYAIASLTGVMVLLQCIPVPEPLVKLFSPLRGDAIAQAFKAADFPRRFISLSSAPEETIRAISALFAAFFVFFLARELMARTSFRWALIGPSVLVGCFESFVALNSDARDVAGSLINRNHLAGLLELLLPFSVAYTLLCIRSARSDRGYNLAKGATALIVSILIMAAIAKTCSRMGLISATAATVVCFYGSIPRTWAGRRLLGVLIALVVGCLCIMAMLPNTTIRAVQSLVWAQDLSASSRIETWRGTLRMIGDYSLAGIGLGGFDAVFPRYQTAEVMYRFDHAHQDFLEWFAEVGILGAAVLIGFVCLLARALRRGWQNDETRFFAVACTASLAAIALHSLTDFNLRIPANGLLTAWIAGLGSSLGRFAALKSSHHVPRSGRTFRQWMVSAAALAVCCACFPGVLPATQEGSDNRNVSASADLLNCEKRVSSSPSSPYPWCDLAAAYAVSGDESRADACFRRAVDLAPSNPRVLTRALNYYAQNNNGEQSTGLARRVLRLTRGFDSLVFADLDWLRIDSASALTNLVPRDPEALRAYFEHVRSNSLEEESRTWKWIEKNGLLTPSLVAAYTDDLVTHDRAADAYSVWRHYTLDPSDPNELIYQGGFETEATGALFDWRMAPVEGVEVTRDKTRAHSGEYSLKLSFHPASHARYMHTVQELWLEPGVYRFGASIWQEQPDFEPGIQFQFVDSHGARTLNTVSKELPSALSWLDVSLTVAIPKASGITTLAIVRRPSSASSAAIWIDDLTLKRIPEKAVPQINRRQKI